MKNIFKTLAVLIFSVAIFSFSGKQHCNSKELAKVYTDTEYVCLPCGSDCDNTVYSKPGTCPKCMMKLVDKASIKFHTIEPDALCAFITDMGKNNVILLDVRTREEFNGTSKDKFGKLKGAINIPVQELDKRMSELNKYKNKEIVVYCSHSHRSPMASYMLTQKGFTRVTNMEYGMSEWKNKVEADGCSEKLYIKQ